jgi:hypothetical protein
LRGQRVGAGEHGEGVFLADAVESGDGLQHDLLLTATSERIGGWTRFFWLRTQFHPIGSGKSNTGAAFASHERR